MTKVLSTSNGSRAILLAFQYIQDSGLPLIIRHRTFIARLSDSKPRSVPFQNTAFDHHGYPLALCFETFLEGSTAQNISLAVRLGDTTQPDSNRDNLGYDLRLGRD